MKARVSIKVPVCLVIWPSAYWLWWPARLETGPQERKSRSRLNQRQRIVHRTCPQLRTVCIRDYGNRPATSPPQAKITGEEGIEAGHWSHQQMASAGQEQRQPVREFFVSDTRLASIPDQMPGRRSGQAGQAVRRQAACLTPSRRLADAGLNRLTVIATRADSDRSATTQRNLLPMQQIASV